MKKEEKNSVNVGKDYKYDAFISYRHTELDKFVAENLHKQMEAFRLPKKISRGKQDGRTRIERVFRDRDELPLTNNLEDPIRKALEQSEYLIVICSPRLRESLWCKKEIETFIELHGRQRILAVLVEGEPDESFPEELLGWKEEVKKPDGTSEIVEHRMEPLAADVRGKDKRAVLKAMKTEILRLLAPMFGLNYDDLRQRHRERRMRRILSVAITVAAVCLAFGSVSTVMALYIGRQNERIIRQNERITSQNEQISSQNLELVAKQEQIQRQNDQLVRNQALNLAEDAFTALGNGDRLGALNTAVSALTQYQGIRMPYTAKAQYALTEGLHVYDNRANLKALYQMETQAVISFLKVSPEQDRFLTCDQADGVILWDVSTGKILKKLPDSLENEERSCAFLDNDRVVYLNGESRPVVYDYQSDQAVEAAEGSRAYHLTASGDGKYVVAGSGSEVWAVDGTNPNRTIFADTVREGANLFNMVFHGENSDIMAYVYQADHTTYVRFVNLKDQLVLSELELGDHIVGEISFMGDTAWVLASRFKEEESINMDSALWAFDMQAGETRWKQTFDWRGNTLRRPHAEGAEHLLVISGTESYLVRMDDGSIAYRGSLGAMPAAAYSLSNSDMFLIFTRGAEYEILLPEQMTSIARMDFFHCHSQNLKSVNAVIGGYLVLPYQDNRVTMYGCSDQAELTKTDEPVPDTRDRLIQYSAAREFAAEAGLPNANMVQTVFFDPEETLCFVYHANGCLEIYDNADMQLLAVLNDIDEFLDRCYGRDGAGNLYVASASRGYMLDPDYEILAKIEVLRYVNKEENYMVLETVGGELCRTPIYTLEELLAKAGECMISFE